MADESKLDNRRIMKNSMMLYLRTLMTMVIGLYNSRVVLNVLGFDDYGIYSVVGSIVVMFGFFTSSISSSISRFMSYELASGDKRRLESTFNSGMLIVLGFAGIILVLAETVGLWLFGRLNLPEGSHTAAMWVYQLSVVTAILNLLQTSYIATIIAHERMGAFALIDIVNSVLKLGAIFVLEFVMFNKLELYAGLVMLVMLAVTGGTAIYCRRQFAECRLRLRPDRKVIKPMLSFSKWSLFKTGCDTMLPSGLNVVVNLFFGVALNVAVGVALNVYSNAAKFVSNVFVAFKPQIIKAFSLREFGNMQSLLANALRMSLAMQLLLTVPLIIEMPYVLRIWLGEYPDYAVLFCRLLLVSMFFWVILAILEYGINATGKIRSFSLVTGLFVVSTVFIAMIAFSLGAPPQAAYIAQICTAAASVVAAMIIQKSLVRELRMMQFVWIYVRVVLVALAAYAAGEAVVCAMDADNFLRLMAVCAATTLVGGAGIWLFVLTGSAKALVLKKLKLRK